MVCNIVAAMLSFWGLCDYNCSRISHNCCNFWQNQWSGQNCNYNCNHNLKPWNYLPSLCDQVLYTLGVKLQAFAYALMSAGSAASGVTNLNRTGIRHTALPDFCKPLHKFCDHVAISIAFTFISCFLLATSAVQDVLWLSQHWNCFI